MPSLPKTLLLLTLLLPACSNFEDRWQKAQLAAAFSQAGSLSESSSRPAPITSLDGAWQGTWQSAAGHGSGSLRALITPSPNDPQLHNATFKSTFWNFLSATYTVNLTTTQTPGSKLTFHGAKDLGPLAGGTYTYDGSTHTNSLQSTYTSKSDHGSFTLTRAP